MQIREGSVEEAIDILAGVPELRQDRDLGYYTAKLGTRPYLVLIAANEMAKFGFKIGYALSAEHFYSWVGGVLPAYRGLGVAELLLQTQERWVWSHHYRLITVRTSQNFPAMITMLRKNLYEEIGMDGERMVFSKAQPNNSFKPNPLRGSA